MRDFHYFCSTMKNKALENYLNTEILRRYAHFDAAHRLDHVTLVMEQSKYLAEVISTSPNYRNPDGTKMLIDTDMALTIAAYHDTGLCESRETHHLVSGQIIRSDTHLKEWFTPEQIETMAQAAEDHRASAKGEPRSIYGRIVAEADRAIDSYSIIRRTVQYGVAHYPQLNKDQQFTRALEHLHEKYAEGGYLKLWIPESPNGERLAQLRAIIHDEDKLRKIFEDIWKNL